MPDNLMLKESVDLVGRIDVVAHKDNRTVFQMPGLAIRIKSFLCGNIHPMPCGCSHRLFDGVILLDVCIPVLLPPDIVDVLLFCRTVSLGHFGSILEKRSGLACKHQIGNIHGTLRQRINDRKRAFRTDTSAVIHDYHA